MAINDHYTNLPLLQNQPDPYQQPFPSGNKREQGQPFPPRIALSTLSIREQGQPFPPPSSEKRQLPHDYITIIQMDSEEDDRFDVNGGRHQDYSEGNNSSKSNESASENSQVELELTEKENLELGILEQLKNAEKKNPYQDQITRDIVGKLKDLAQAAISKSGEELVNIKIQELALSKLLVLNYGKSDFRLVLAHYHLGEAYLAFDCLEQAIEHVSLALHKNQKLTPDVPMAELVQINMYITLAEAFMAQGNYDDAIQILGKAANLQEGFQSGQSSRGEPSKNVKILALKAQCFCKQKHFEEALSVIDEVVTNTRSKRTSKVQYAFSLVDRANILSEMGSPDKLQRAIQNQQQAINILVQQNYPRPQEVAELYSTLSAYFERINNPQSALTCIQKVKTLYEELYSPQDKRVIKARRKIATALLKSERYKEAVTELLQISKLEEKVFGETLQLARTLKLLGTVYISLEIGDARVYLKRAMDIFHSLGNKKQVQEIKEKLKSLFNDNAGEIDVNVISEQDI